MGGKQIGRHGLFQGDGKLGKGRGLLQPQPGFLSQGLWGGRQGLQGRQLGFQGRGKQGLGRQGRPQMPGLMIELIFIFVDSNVFQIFGVSRAL